MGSERGNDVPDILIMINVLIAASYIVVAVLANTLLLQKDERLRRDQKHARRTGVTVTDRRLPATLHSSPGFKERPAIGVPLRGNTSESSRSTTPVQHATPVRATNAAGNGEDSALLTPRAKMRATTSRARHGGTGGGGGGAAGGAGGGGANPPTDLRRSFIFRDYTCWFFILIIVFSLTRATVVLILTLGSRQTMNTADNRKRQDYIVTPATILFYSVFIVLLNTMYYMAEEDKSKTGTRKYKIRIGAMIVAAIVALVAGMASEAANDGDSSNVVEYIAFTIDIIFAVVYAATAVRLPTKLLAHGDVAVDIARKVRTVSVLVSICMLVRAVLLFPELQSALGRALKDYSLAIIMPFELIPVLASIRVLHATGGSSGNVSKRNAAASSVSGFGFGGSASGIVSETL